MENIAAQGKNDKSFQEGIHKMPCLNEDMALRSFLSREIKNNSIAFHDYAPTAALVEAAIDDLMEILNI